MFEENRPAAPTGARGKDEVGGSPETAVSIHTLTRAAKAAVEQVRTVWVRGEVSEFKAYSSGHWYFTLRDAESSVRCVMWRELTKKVASTPDVGMVVTACGKLTVFPKTGQLQFAVSWMGAAGDGLWRKALDERIARLRADGLLDEARKRPLPTLPRRIAVITSADGAAWHDIRTVAASRFAGIPLVLVPARVQGDGAAASLIEALDAVTRWGGADVCIIGRGGGSSQDLWEFNDEALARAVAGMPIPVISAVGHETDISIVDLVADLRAATPSQAAEAAVPAREALVAATAALGRRLTLGAGRAMARRRETLRVVGGRFASGARRLRAVETTRLERLRSLMSAAMRARLVRERAVLAGTLPAIRTRIDARLGEGRTTVGRLSGALQALSPLATLERGFTVVRDAASARALPSAADVAPGQLLDLLFRDGAVRARAEHVRAGDPLEAVTGFPDE
jgi:exodeoxyribonuclease VII large subunit